MAALAANAVTTVRTSYEWNKPFRLRKCAEVELVLTGHGGVSNSIDASTLGFKTIEEVSSGIKSDSLVIVPAAPGYDKTKVLLASLAVDSAAGTDLTGTFRFVVKGVAA